MKLEKPSQLSASGRLWPNNSVSSRPCDVRHGLPGDCARKTQAIITASLFADGHQQVVRRRSI